MTAFLLERLYPTGWRRGGELFFRLADANREAERIVHDHDARGVRVLPVRIGASAIVELYADESADPQGAEDRQGVNDAR